MVADSRHFSFRRFRHAEDAEMVCRFFLQMLDQQFSSTFTAQALDSYRRKYSESNMSERIAQSNVVIAGLFDDDKLIGLVIGGAPNGGVASLDWVVVAPDYQGQGLGQKLMRFCFHEYAAVGAHKILLYTETENAKRFYEKCGMALEGVHPNHWWGLTHYCLAIQTRYLDPLSESPAQEEESGDNKDGPLL
ncbi:GNAT family N-acetyltransferase [Hahella ganghwensis]|uniref:GNAT family N-acetyltransferase n=1 Tax=Hahella ganghwensis TaxID=286420 RepID=UPI00035E42E4|nr:GNAT family N-acetyltransferase [Hahella ganghwensis]